MSSALLQLETEIKERLESIPFFAALTVLVEPRKNIVAEVTARIALSPCNVTVAQFGPGERWFSHHHVYECVTAAREIPPYVLTSPLQR